MNRMKLLGGMLAAVVCAAPAAAQDKKEPTLKQTLDSLLGGMGAEKIPDRRSPQQQWQRICLEAGAPGNEARRAEVCRLMAARLGPDVANPARIWLLKQLQVIGRGECVEAAAKLVDDQDAHVRDAARRCLANNPDPKATAALAAKLEAEQDAELRVGLLNALGYRADAGGGAAAAKALGDPTEAVACAAARALGKIATPEAAKALAAARPKAKGELRFRICDAYKLCADRLREAGKADEAMAMYKALYQPAESRAVRLAALKGMLRAAGEKAGTMVLDLLAGADADARAIAGEHVAELSSAAVKALASGAHKLPAAGQVLLLGALAAKGDKAAAPAAATAAKSKNETLQLAGLRALADLGDASTVPLLIEAFFTSGKARGAARDSLAALRGKGVDERIVAAVQAEENAHRRGELIGVLESRRASSAAPAILKETLHDDVLVRRRAMSALRYVGRPEHIPGMVRGLLKAQAGRERDDAERAVAEVCRLIDDKSRRAGPILSAVADASEADKAVVLPLLGRLGGPKALAMVRQALKSDSAAYHEAGVRALCNWPNANVIDELVACARDGKQSKHRVWALEALARVTGLWRDRRRREKPPAPEKAAAALNAVRAARKDAAAEVRAAAVRALAEWPMTEAAGDLLELARTADKDEQRVPALRGYIRLAADVAGKSPEKAVKMYEQALAAATRADEKKRALSGLGRVPTPAALKVALAHTGAEGVAREAAWAVCSIADRLRGSQPAEARAALEKVLAAAKDKRVRQRAEEVLKRIKPQVRK